MATRKRRKRTVVKPPVVEEEEILEEEDLEDDEEEIEEPEPKKPARRRRRKVVEEPTDDDEEEEDEVEEKPVKKVTRRRTKKKVVEPEPEPEPQVANVSDLDVFYGLLENLDDGATLVITRTGEDTWSVSGGSAAVLASGPQKLKGKAYYDEVYSMEFIEHHEMWKQLTASEKKAQAKKLKATWEPHEDERVEVMRVTAAVRAKLGIEKYKEQYQTRAARAAIKA